jgi:hypothetical protein
LRIDCFLSLLTSPIVNAATPQGISVNHWRNNIFENKKPKNIPRIIEMDVFIIKDYLVLLSDTFAR